MGISGCILVCVIDALLVIIEFPNLCALASLIMISISGSNSSVECTFSFLTNILSDKCLSMSHDTLENSVIVSGNNCIWSEKEKEEIVNRALEIYLSKQRCEQTQLDQTQLKNCPAQVRIPMEMMKTTLTVKMNTSRRWVDGVQCWRWSSSYQDAFTLLVRCCLTNWYKLLASCNKVDNFIRLINRIITNRKYKKVGVLPIRIVWSNVSSIGPSSERKRSCSNKSDIACT